jgi:uncharacterized protein YjbI with pentapeptide repeats
MTIAEATTLPGTVLLHRVIVSDVDLSRAKFDRMVPSGCTFVRCDFRTAALDRRLSPLFKAREQNVFRECRFDGADLRSIDPGPSRFEACVFDGADLRGWTPMLAEFVDCHFAGRLERVRFHGRPWGAGADDILPRRDANAFRGNDFSAAEMIDVAFVMGIDLAQQRWPDGREYIRLDRIHQRLTRGHQEILHWKDLESRSEAMAMMRELSLLYRQQNDVIARRSDPRRVAVPEVQDRVWSTLSAVL